MRAVGNLLIPQTSDESDRGRSNDGERETAWEGKRERRLALGKRRA